MKKLIIAFIMLFTTAATYAQFNKGRMLVGGTLGFTANTSKVKQNGTTSIDGKEVESSFEPQFGYFIINNLAVGTGINLSLSRFREYSGDDYESISQSLQIAPFVRYYIKPGIFFQGTYRIGPQFNKYTYSSSFEKVNSTVSGWALSSGYALFLNDHVAIEPMVGYAVNTEKVKADGNSNEYKGISSGLFFRIGFQIYLGDKK